MDGEFDWSSEVQGVVLGSFYYGYIITQIPGGYVAEKFTTKYMMLSCVSFATLFSLLGPTLARLGYAWLCVGRALHGFFEGPVFPCLYVTAASWLPKEEKTFIFSCIMTGELASA